MKEKSNTSNGVLRRRLQTLLEGHLHRVCTACKDRGALCVTYSDYKPLDEVDAKIREAFGSEYKDIDVRRTFTRKAIAKALLELYDDDTVEIYREHTNSTLSLQDFVRVRLFGSTF